MGTFETTQISATNVTIFDTSLNYPVFEVKSLSEQFVVSGQRILNFAIYAVSEALKDAGLIDQLSSYRVGVCMGTTVVGQFYDLGLYESFKTSPSTTAVDNYLRGNLADFIAKRFKTTGPTLTVVNACSSGADAIGIGLSWLRRDLCDIVIVGGADELSEVTFYGYNALGLMSQDSICAPFDRDRKGLTLGEGAGALVLESKALAKRRGKKANLYVIGYGSASDAFHRIAPRPDGSGLTVAINEAIAESGITPDDIGFVNAHGAGLIDNDKVEGAVLFNLFGEHINVYSTKGYTGHTLGAAGAIEAIFTLNCLQEGWIPETVGFNNKDDDIPLIPTKERKVIYTYYALSTSHSFGGHHAALAFGVDL
jgi:3-oxoacyl-(acyl-carrier-protein) synthase